MSTMMIDEWVEPDFHQINLDIETVLKQERGYKLDAGKRRCLDLGHNTVLELIYLLDCATNVADADICRPNLDPEGCPLGSSCPLRHTIPSTSNFRPPPPIPSHPRDREKTLTVCKHYLRGLCIMGKNCEFLHEYDLRKFPECWWWGTYGFCSAGDECLYWHPRERKRDCEDYERGFCRLGERRAGLFEMKGAMLIKWNWMTGPECPRRHVRKTLCPFYMAGFCPDGPKCINGQYVYVLSYSLHTEAEADVQTRLLQP